MKAIINHQEPITKDKPGSAAEPQFLLNLALMCFTSSASPYHTRHFTDPALAAPEYPGFGSCVCCPHRSFLAACRQAIRSQVDTDTRTRVPGNNSSGGGLHAETPRAAPSAAEMRHLLFNIAVASPSRKIFPT